MVAILPAARARVSARAPKTRSSMVEQAPNTPPAPPKRGGCNGLRVASRKQLPAVAPNKLRGRQLRHDLWVGREVGAYGGGPVGQEKKGEDHASSGRHRL